MSFFLIKYIGKNGFDVFTKDHLQNNMDQQKISILQRGDEDLLKETLNKLKSKCYIRMKNCIAPSNLRHPQETSCTLTESLKCSLSPRERTTDPFATDSGSNVEYIPRIDVSSNSSRSSVSKKGVTRKRKVFNAPKKVLLLEDHSIPSSYVPAQSNGSTTAAVIFGEVKLVADDFVLVKFLRTCHVGSYNVPLQKVSLSQLGKDVFIGSLTNSDFPSSHECASIDSRRENGYVLYDENKCNVVVSLNFCVSKGRFEGKLLYIKETKKWTAFLKSVDADEVHASPAKEGTKIKMKQHHCLYCKKLKTCIGRHYKLQHEKEERIQEILKAPRSQAFLLMRKLRLEGDLDYNERVPLHHRIPVRKHETQIVSNSVHCPSCSALIAARNFNKHHRACSGRAPDGRRRVKNIQVEERLKRITQTENEALFQKVLQNMRSDELKEVIERDSLLKSYAIYLVKSQSSSHNLNNARQLLRRSARLFVQVRLKASDVKEMEDLFKPNMYQLVMECLREVCNFCENYDNRKAQLALSYGPIISSLVTRLMMDLLMNNVAIDDSKIKMLESFQKIHQEEFKTEITRQALISSKHKQMSNLSDLPSSADIQMLIRFLQNLGNDLFNKLKICFELFQWIQLQKVILCQLLVFNRRRVGEMSRIRVQDFEKRRNVTPEFYKSLNRLEIILANEFSVITIMAKRTRPVNILISRTQIEIIHLLNTQREKAGISFENTYLFASPSQSDGYLKASDVLRSFANECGASKPDSLTSTKLRKHVATMSQLLSLNDNEMKQLADFLGHDRTVHENFYRLNESNTQITKLSKFLCIVGDKQVFKHRGMSIESLPFDGVFQNENSESQLESSDEELDDVLINETSINDQKLRQVDVDRAINDEPKKAGNYSQRKEKYSLRRRSRLRVPSKFKSPMKLMEISSSTKSSTTSQLLKLVAVPKKRCVEDRKRWTEQEIKIMEMECASYLINKRLPSLSECKEIKNRHLLGLQQRPTHSIYCWLRNRINRLE